jgi:hypothetical protein
VREWQDGTAVLKQVLCEFFEIRGNYYESCQGYRDNDRYHCFGCSAGYACAGRGENKSQETEAE